jgi:myo-inositol-1(or 4)-monophosphatase
VKAKPGRPRDVVTEADVAVEDLVRRSLEGASGLPVVGEERGGTPPGSGAYWLVDPICGTRNYASGIPLFAVNLALVEDGQLTVAAVADGSTGQILVAERGRGAYDLGPSGARRLQASLGSQVVVLGGWPLPGGYRTRAARFLAELIEADRWDLRILATTLGLAYVAAGRVAADVYFGASALHYGAGALLAAESGAVVTDLEGSPFRVESTSLLVAATPELHGELRALAAASSTG